VIIEGCRFFFSLIIIDPGIGLIISNNPKSVVELP
jgi:hypothetical protein